ncbi:MAG: glycolate oxidase subunit GlcE [Pseudomonadota bacterium]|nr:glycolate oxidase subunit GlcE [Pseudomonadota bacterium]
MLETLKPDTPEQIRDAVRWAAENETPIELIGHGTKRELGRPGNVGHTLEVSALSGITLYEQEELVLSAGAGTPLSEIEETVGASCQQLAFEPPDFSALLKKDTGKGTLGGTIACNLSGPRRIKAGAARDHFLGFKAISGRGDDYKSGGRVVKNVTGYDLCKLLAGSWGTLGVMTELTIKVLPAPEKTRTVLVMELDAARAVTAMTRAFQSPHDVTAGAWIPKLLTVGSAVSYVRDAGTSVAAIRIEGPGPSVEYRCKTLREELAEFGQTEELHGHNSDRFWTEVRDVLPFANEGDNRLVWRISVPPQTGAIIVDKLTKTSGSTAFLDWGGGLVWLATPQINGASADEIRAAIIECGGHATLIRAPEELRATVPVFQPQLDSLAKLSGRIKQGFDPLGVLNPGRMYAGM